MIYTYKKCRTEEKFGNVETSIKRIEDGACIPIDENNRDYCGVKITSSPCDGDACTKGKLNKIDYFETLLDS